MCLIDEVLDWSESEIHCRTASHRLKSNPLRTADHLRSECGIEYAAQAIAIHGALNVTPAAPAPVAGMLASVRGVELHVPRLDDVEDALTVRAWRRGGDVTALLYEFSIAGGAKTLLAGRATIVLRPPASTPSGARSHQ